MNKNIKIFSLVLATLFVVSCDNNDATGDSTLVVTPNVVGSVTPITSTLSFTATNNVAEVN
ncbi:MAG: hypothetical protein RL308_667, partial [Bacteroidota bacterium]